MTRQEQIDFVRELSKNVAEDIVDSIERGRIPSEWDGRELRLLLADKHSEWDMATRADKRRYRNTVLVNNL